MFCLRVSFVCFSFDEFVYFVRVLFACCAFTSFVSCVGVRVFVVESTDVLTAVLSMLFVFWLML